jgi:hypothetical protein
MAAIGYLWGVGLWGSNCPTFWVHLESLMRILVGKGTGKSKVGNLKAVININKKVFSFDVPMTITRIM